MKLSVPCSLSSLTESDTPKILDTLKKCKVDRVFICGFPYLKAPEEEMLKTLEKTQKFLQIFKSAGYEVGIWLDSFGHGGPLTTEKNAPKGAKYTPIRGFGLFDRKEKVYCPLNKYFRSDYIAYIKRFAALDTDIIMLDDDFRFSLRGYGVGCACNAHMRALSKAIGRPISRKGAFNRIFLGKPNAVRSAWEKITGDSLMDFAKDLRNAVDEVNDKIRLGACTCVETWDAGGVDAVELAKAFAGDKTKPFLRTIGAPYWMKNNLGGGNLGSIIEFNRSQAAYCKNKGVEVFCEGDVYPRPMYNVPACYLEAYHLALVADGLANGMLKYMFCYNHTFDYEMGYAIGHCRNENLRKTVEKYFRGTTATGVYDYVDMHKFNIADMDLSEADTSKTIPYSYSGGKELLAKAVRKAERKTVGIYEVSTLINHFSQPHAHVYFAINGIPTTYIRDDKLPISIMGYNAETVPEEWLSCGAILDVRAAKILEKRGIDVGLIAVIHRNYKKQKFLDCGYELALKNPSARGMKAKENATPLAYYDGKDVSAYTYENANGQRFFVLGADLYTIEPATSDIFFGNYCTQEMLIKGIEYVGKKPLPAKCLKHPKLYCITAKDKEGNLVVGLFNLSEDTVYMPKVELDGNYQKAECELAPCVLSGNTLEIEGDITPYAAFVIKLFI